MKSGKRPLSKGTLVSRLLTPWPGRLEHPKMFRYLPQSGASPLWPVLFVWVLLNSCCGELKYTNFSEINSIIHYHRPECGI